MRYILMKGILVSDVMTHDPITIDKDANLLECAKKMIHKKVGSLVLVDKGKFVGFISEHDILWAIIKKSTDDLKKIKAMDISPRKIVKIRPSATVKDALMKIKKYKFERIPVVQDNELLGLITVKDILNFHPELYPELEEFAKIREETNKLKRIKTKFTKEGICEECGNHGWLQRVDGMLICENCVD